MSKQYKIIIPLASLFAALLLILFFGLSSRPQNDNDILAESDIGTLDKKEFIARYQKYLRRTGINDNIPARQSILSQMLNEKLLLSTIKPTITQNIDYKKEIISKRDDFLVSVFADKFIKPNISVTDKELRKRYVVESTSYRIKQLFTITEDDAQHAKKLLEEGFELEEVAWEFKVPPMLDSNINDLGFVAGEDLKRKALLRLALLDKNGVTEPIKVPTGYTILQLLDKKPRPLITEFEFANEKKRLRRTLQKEHLKMNAISYVDEYLAELDVEWDESTLSNFRIYINSENIESYNSALSETLSKYLLQTTSVIARWESDEFTVGDYFEWSSRLYYRAPADLRDQNNLQAYILGLISRKYLVSESIKMGLDNESQFLKNYALSIRYAQLSRLQKIVVDTSTITEKEIKEFYNTNYADYYEPEKVKLVEIIVKSRSFAEALIDSIGAGTSASTLAANYTLRESAREFGGNFGYISVDDLGIFRQSISETSVGNVTEPLEHGDYYLIFQVLDRVESYKPTYVELEPELRKQYVADYWNAILDKTYSRLKREQNAKIFMKRLNTINLVEETRETSI